MELRYLQPSILKFEFFIFKTREKVNYQKKVLNYLRSLKWFYSKETYSSTKTDFSVLLENQNKNQYSNDQLYASLCIRGVRNVSYLEKFAYVLNGFFQANNRNNRKRCEICSELTIKTPERRHCPFLSVSIVDFEQVNVSGYVL